MKITLKKTPFICFVKVKKKKEKKNAIITIV